MQLLERNVYWIPAYPEVEYMMYDLVMEIAQGRYNNASEVIRAGLRLLEENESRLTELKAAIREGIDSGVTEGFDPEEHLKTLKAKRTNG